MPNIAVSYSTQITGNQSDYWDSHSLKTTAAPPGGDFIISMYLCDKSRVIFFKLVHVTKRIWYCQQMIFTAFHTSFCQEQEQQQL